MTTTHTILQGHCLDTLRALPGGTVQTVVTSPPYWMLRQYEGDQVVAWPQVDFIPVAGLPDVTIPTQDAALGLEPDPWAFIGHMVLIFREIRRVLRADGTAFVNMGDSYTSGGKGGGGSFAKDGIRTPRVGTDKDVRPCWTRGWRSAPYGLKDKELAMMPARLALALQADGWYVRQTIIWHKPRPMPESCRDRCTTAHEYVYHLAASERYYYNADAIMEPASEKTHPRIPHGWATGRDPHSAIEHQAAGVHPKASRATRGQVRDNASFARATLGKVTMANKRSVWTIPPEPCMDDHFAAYPTALPQTCILAGSRPGDTVLDPFAGTGRTGAAAKRTGRNSILCELSETYCDYIRETLDAETEPIKAIVTPPAPRAVTVAMDLEV